MTDSSDKASSSASSSMPRGTAPADGPTLVVGLGASAGGIAALKRFFASVPANSGMAYVVILHLSPDHESRLAQVLQSTALIPVMQVTERTQIEPNHVYVVSPNKKLTMDADWIVVSEITGIEERRAPVDMFFRTLADSHNAAAVAVILSGTGANGSMGLKHVKEYGGLCLAQDPAEAEFADMPSHAIATRMVDYVLPVAEMAARIIAYRAHLGKVDIPSPEHDADDQRLVDIFTHLRVRTGHDFSNYKRSTVLRRLQRRITVHELPDLSSYAAYLREHRDEANALVQDLLISVTNFFRDLEVWATLESSLIPKLFESKGAQDDVRVWVVGCATGEEAYSLAMMLLEYAPDPINGPSLQVFATDIDETALTKARAGLYTLNDAADISPERLRRFFLKDGDGFRVRRELREMVLFASHNVLTDPPFSHLDMVSCRNLMIYLNEPAQERLLRLFHFGLHPGGYLMLGTSESTEAAANLFVAVDKDKHVFQSRPVETRIALPVLGTARLPAMPVFPQDQRASALRQRLSYQDLHLRVLEEYAPPSALIDQDYDILHLSEHAGRYLQVGGGEPAHNLLKMVRPELRLELHTALHQAMQRRTSTEVRGLPLTIDGNGEQ